jgi:hypothetical protein
LILDIVWVSPVKISLELKFLKKEIQKLLVRSLEIARIVILLEVSWDLLGS